MTDEFLTASRTKSLRRLLLAIVVLAALLLPLAVLLILDSNVQGGIVLAGIAAVVGVSAWLARTAVVTGAPNARRLCILTAVVTMVFSLPLVQLLVGLLMVVAAIALFFVVFAGDRKPR